ncbi:O-methyltransferase MdmC-like [Zingiber officinale]|uniref:O-methyltransferase MdmC-like n=1 Tax=Zingiber officinale TaxID=94328 RepID=UPI001C4CBE82|nr:O-methyltransferase MdmC-like [Zingiber officinale]
MAAHPLALCALLSSLLSSRPLLSLRSFSHLRSHENSRRLLSLPILHLLPNHARRLATRAEPSVVTSEDDSYGGKQVINLTPHLYDYVLSNVREHPILRKLREETSTMPGSQMQVSPDQAQLLVMLAQIIGAQRCIEVGVYTGYSSLAIAMVLPETGRLVACERDERCLEIAKKYYTRAGVAHKVDIKHGLAVDSLKSLIQHGESSSFDFAFVDAEKRMYNEYFELLLRLVRVGGLIIIDNVLWHGKVADPQVNDPKTASIRNFNRKLLEDQRISTSMVPIGDGMTICQKRATV